MRVAITIGQKGEMERIRKRLENTQNQFEDCYTLDPTETLNAWKKMDTDTFMQDMEALPDILYLAFFDSMKELEQE